MSSARPPRSPLVIAAGEIDPSASRPASEQIADVIQNRISTGKLRIGDPLPSVRELGLTLTVNKATVTRAYHILRDHGLVVPGPGRGRAAVWLVRAQPPVRVMDVARFDEEWARLVATNGTLDPETTAFCREYGVHWSEYTVSVEYESRPALETHAQLMRVPVGSEVLRRELVEHAKGVPVQLRRSVMLATDVAGTLVANPDEQPYPNGTLGELWHLGLRFVRVLHQLRSRVPTPDEARKLNLPGTVHVWEITRRFIAVDRQRVERVVEVSEQIMQSDGNTLVF